MSNAGENGSATPSRGADGDADSGDLSSRFRSGADPALGKVVGGKYAIESILGVGGFGTVYRAIQRPVGRPVALKVVHPRHAHDAQLRARFFREARLVAKLNDRVVVTLHDYGESPEFGLYMAFELIEGTTLNALLERGPQPAERVANILLQLLRALEEAHGLGMIHRDLKPGNVMLVEDAAAPFREGVRLLDFGIAKLKVDLAGQDESLSTQQGLFMGTPSCISPEQARASGEIDGRADLYALGVLGYSLLAGKNPFVGASVVETILAHCNTEPPPFDERLQVPALMESAIMKALAKSPEDRFASAMQMAAALEAAVPSLISGIFVRPWSDNPDMTTPSGMAVLGTMGESAQNETWSQALPVVSPSWRRWALLALFLFGTIVTGWWLWGPGTEQTVQARLPPSDPEVSAPSKKTAEATLPAAALEVPEAVGDPEPREAIAPEATEATPSTPEANPSPSAPPASGETTRASGSREPTRAKIRRAEEPPRSEKPPPPSAEAEPTLVIPEF